MDSNTTNVFKIESPFQCKNGLKISLKTFREKFFFDTNLKWFCYWPSEDKVLTPSGFYIQIVSFIGNECIFVRENIDLNTQEPADFFSN